MGASQQLLAKLLHSPPERMGLALLSLAVAKEEHTELNVAHYLECMVALADHVCGRLSHHVATGDILYQMNTLLFDEEGYESRAGIDQSGEPYLHLLLEHHRGTPESLIILYLTLGRLLHLPLQCVSLAGRLLLRLEGNGEEEDVIDPCAFGVVLTRDELHVLLTDALGNFVEPLTCYRPFLNTLDDRALMVRMLTRHKEYYLIQGAYERALLMVDMILDLTPDNDSRRLERARLLELLQQPEAAAAGYLNYLENNPDSQWLRELRLRAQLLLSDPTIIH